MSLPAEPRQKMINLMYLVLTAMLALNVSAEILNAFKIVDRSLTGTNGTINNSTNTIMSSLNEKRSDPSSATKANIWYPKAQQAQAYAKTTYDYITSLKSKILAGAEFKKEDSSYKQDNLDVATHVMVTEGEGKKLRQMLQDYRDNLLKIDPLVGQELKNSLQIDVEIPPVQNKANKTWEDAYFHMVPTVAAITMLSKFQNDVKTSENKVVAFCHEQVGKVAVRFDTYAAIIGQSSSYVMPGQEIEITAGVGAFSKAAQPSVTINGSGAALGEDGAAHAKFSAGGVGAHSVPVSIVYVDQEGKKQTITKQIEYTVGQSATAISLTKMNVLYIGVDNPVSIAASGGAEQLQPSIVGGGGSLTKTGPGQYIARVNSVTDDCRIVVNVAGKTAGQQVFRVRTIPDPVAAVGGTPSGENVPAGSFKAQGGVGAYIKDFPFELKYSVTSFSISADTDDGDIAEAASQGNAWSPQARALVNRVHAGQMVTIDNIRAVGPDGRSRKLPSLVYYIK
ncbi:MAG TPA: gliding motility protein GldM [Chitinophagaceae bacterium]|nr:gliding motility protein GldM [Chitinophagaceae bacterium]